MSSQLQVTKEFENGTWTVTMVILPGGTLPEHIFLHVNEEGELGDFYAVCTKENLTRPIYEEGMNTFGVPYARHDEVTRDFSAEADADAFVTAVRQRVEALDVELTNNLPDITIYDIPPGV